MDLFSINQLWNLNQSYEFTNFIFNIKRWSGHWAHAGIPGKKGGSRVGTGGLARLGLRLGSTVEQRKLETSKVREDRKRNDPSEFATDKYYASAKTQNIVENVGAIVANSSLDKLRIKGDKLAKEYESSLDELNKFGMDINNYLSKRKSLLDKLDRQQDGITKINNQIIDEGLKVNKRIVDELRLQEQDRGNVSISGYQPLPTSIGLDAFNKIVSKDVSNSMRVPVRDQKTDGVSGKNDQSGRAYHQDGTIYINSETPSKTVVHEMGHALEFNNPDVSLKARKFRLMRCKGQQIQKLSAVLKDGQYSDDEITVPDKFPHPYVGKIYNSTSTEITSMGLEYLSSNPLKFYREDPEYFSFMVDIAQGR